MNKSFSNAEEKVFWIEEIIRKFQEGSASDEEIADFRSLLLEDVEARQIYHESNQLTLLLESVEAQPATAKTIRFKAVTRWAAGIAAVLAIGIWIFLQNPGAPNESAPKTPWLATLSSSHEAVWKNPLKTRKRFQKEHLSLLSGIAELEFENGAQFVIEGPCELTLIDEDSIELVSGKLWGYCPPAARGFEVLAPGENRIVDLGTEFGVGVDPSGAVDVHVFDGEVEVSPASREKQSVEAGSAIHLAPDADMISLNANLQQFTNSETLQYKRWANHHRDILSRDDQVLYYDMTSSIGEDYSLNNLGPAGANGDITGAIPVKGRIPGKGALLFEKSEDLVSLELEESFHQGFAVAMWIKPTEIQRSHMALLNTDAFPPGAIHFQLNSDRMLSIGICGIGGFRSKANIIHADEWQFVAASWDPATQRATLFYNGEKIGTFKHMISELMPGTIPNFGSAQIGAWGKRTYGHSRNFEGRIGEVMIFNTPLESPGMAELYEASRP